MSGRAPERAFQGWMKAVLKRPRLVLAIALGLCAAAGLSSLLWLRIKPGYLELLSPESGTNARYIELLSELGAVEALHLVIDGPEPQASDLYEKLGPALTLAQGEAGSLIGSVNGQLDAAELLASSPGWVPLPALRELSRPGVLALSARPTVEQLLLVLEEQLKLAARRGRMGDSQAGLIAFSSLLEELTLAARGESSSLGGWVRRLLASRSDGQLDAAGRRLLAGGRLHLTVSPADINNDFVVMEAFLEQVRKVEERVRADIPGSQDVTVLMAGAPVLVVDEMSATRRDVTRSTLVALVLVLLLFTLSFASARHVGAAAAALLVGLVLTFGAALLLVGSLNLFSIVFAAVLVGIGIDFGIHVVNDFERRRLAGDDPHTALVLGARSVGPATALGAVTTAAAFLSTTASEFRGFSQLGLISGVGVLLCLLTAFTVLPALLVRLQSTPEAGSATENPPVRWSSVGGPWSLKVLRLPLRRPGLTCLLGLGLLVGAAFSAPGLRFDYDLLNLQQEGTAAVRAARGGDAQPLNTHLGFLLSDGIGETSRLGEALRALPSVAGVHSAADLLSDDWDERSALLRVLDVDLMRAAGAPPVRSNPATARERIERIILQLSSLQDGAFDGGDDRAVRELDALLTAGEDLRAALLLPGANDGLQAFQRASLAEMRLLRTRIVELAHGSGSAAQRLPAGLSQTLVGKSGRLALVIEPRDPVWERPALEAFVADLRSVHPDVTGPPVQILEVTGLMRSSYQSAALLSLIVISLLVLLVMRDVLATLLALAPLLAGFLITLGSLRWLGVPLNPANLVALPLLLGIGIDNGVHVAHRWWKVRDVAAVISQVGHAVVVTSLTTIAGFSGLLLAGHQGIRSLGVVAVVGTSAMLLCSVAFLPAALALLEGRTSRPQ